MRKLFLEDDAPLQKKINKMKRENFEKMTGFIESLPHKKVDELIDGLKKQLGIDQKNDARYLTIEEVCIYLKVKRVTVWRYSKLGYLNPLKIGGRKLYERADIDNFLKNGISHNEH